MSKFFTFFTHFLYQNPLVIILQVNIKINKTKTKQKNVKKKNKINKKPRIGPFVIHVYSNVTKTVLSRI